MKKKNLKKSYTKCGGETTPRLFSKKLKFSLWINTLAELVFNAYLVEGYQNILSTC